MLHMQFTDSWSKSQQEKKPILIKNLGLSNIFYYFFADLHRSD